GALEYGWRVSAGLGAVVSALAALAVVLVRNARRIVLTESRQGKEAGRREIAALGTFGFVMAGTQWAFLTYLVLFLTEQLHFGLAVAGLALPLAPGLGAGARFALAPPRPLSRKRP